MYVTFALVLQTLKYDNYSLVGWSDGGITALIMAAKYPHRIRKCVTLGANAYITKEEVRSGCSTVYHIGNL